MKTTLLRGLGFLLALALSSLASATTMVGPKHVYILYPGVDAVWGSYIFTVLNDSQAPEHLAFSVMLPKETIDFQAQDTLSPQEISLGKDGGITIDKTFPPGETLLQVGFKLSANQGSGTATLKTAMPFESLGVFVWQNSFNVTGPEGVQIQKGVNLSGRNFDTYSLSNGEAGQSIVFHFDGIQEGRSRLWIIGWVFAGLLILIGLSTAYWTRPKVAEEVV